jgi:phosphomannomutase
MSSKVKISKVMDRSGVKFGTSGARGLVTDMTDEVCYTYTRGFLQYLEQTGELRPGTDVAIAGDLRPSTGRIMAAAARAASDAGHSPVNCGRIPSPAVALYGISNGMPSVMVTGSHIPDDRNGIKYNKPAGEILKDDEAGMMKQKVEIPDIFDGSGMLAEPFDPGPEDNRAADNYVKRWIDAFGPDFLRGRHLGVYQHSAVGRDMMCEIYYSLGAEITKLAPSDSFIPVDTEAIRPEDIELAENWAREHAFDAIVSTDGDSDRPLISDENGNWLRGDVAGILCAKFCGADVVVTPVSCNTAVEKCGSFESVRRTRIGSPYVIAGMLEAVDKGAKCVVGYEANGGFLTASPVSIDGRILAPLPTRDPIIVHLAVLGSAAREGIRISRLLESLPDRFTASDRLKEFPRDLSNSKIDRLIKGGKNAIHDAFPAFGPVDGIDTTDGLRITFEIGDILHLRPSGNAPELRCYTEAGSDDRAREINRAGLEVLKTWRE